MTEDRLFLRQIRCLRCGNLLAWSYATGDSPRVADLNYFFDLMHHGPWWKGHIIRLKKNEL